MVCSNKGFTSEIAAGHFALFCALHGAKAGMSFLCRSLMTGFSAAVHASAAAGVQCILPAFLVQHSVMPFSKVCGLGLHFKPMVVFLQFFNTRGNEAMDLAC